MFTIQRFAVIAYALTVFMGGYLAVATLKNLWTSADNFENLASATSYGEDTLNHTLLVFDAVEPAAGTN